MVSAEAVDSEVAVDSGEAVASEVAAGLLWELGLWLQGWLWDQ